MRGLILCCLMPHEAWSIELEFGDVYDISSTKEAFVE